MDELINEWIDDKTWLVKRDGYNLHPHKVDVFKNFKIKLLS